MTDTVLKQYNTMAESNETIRAKRVVRFITLVYITIGQSGLLEDYELTLNKNEVSLVEPGQEIYYLD